MSMWVMVLVVALVGSAIWYEVQYRHVKGESYAPIKRTSVKRAAPVNPGAKPKSPTNEDGQLIG
jgi:hypothetical protein